MNTYTTNKWTSELIISANKDLDDLKSDLDGIINDLAALSTKWSTGNRDQVTCFYEEQLLNNYSFNGDNTCMMKGIALDNISTLLESKGITDYVISFGGDICCNTENTLSIPIYGTKFTINVTGKVSIFTSGNNFKRGKHIVGCEDNKIVTLIVGWDYKFGYKYRNQLVDALATKLAANDKDSSDDLEYEICIRSDYNYMIPLVIKDNKITNYTYCASPFFNDDQIEIRDRMVSEFTDVFRPDQREIARKYNSNQSDKPELAAEVVLDNEIGISDTDLLLFPNSTDDLGTLFEVGKAIGLDKPIIKFDEKSGTYTIIPSVKIDRKVNLSLNPYLLDCSDKHDVIKLGYLSTIVDKDTIYYMLKGNPDNIMLSVNYIHVESNKDKTFDIYEKKYIESDTKDTKIIGNINGHNKSLFYVPDMIDFNQIYDIDIDYNNKVVTSVS